VSKRWSARIGICLIAGLLWCGSPAEAWIMQIKTVGEVVAVWLLSNPTAVMDVFKTSLGHYKSTHSAEVLANIQKSTGLLLDGYGKADLKAVVHYTKVLEDIRRNEKVSIPELDRLLRRSEAFLAWTAKKECGLDTLAIDLKDSEDLISDPDMKIEIRSPAGRTVYQSGVKRDSRFARWNVDATVLLDDLEVRVYDQDLLGRELVGDFFFRKGEIFRRLCRDGDGYEASFPLCPKAGGREIGTLTLTLSRIPVLGD
jgi:hypothetical protein